MCLFLLVAVVGVDAQIFTVFKKSNFDPPCD